MLTSLLLRLGDPDPAQRLAFLHEPCDDAPIEKVRALWSQAGLDLAIPEVAPVLVEEVGRLPVGGGTPD